MLDKNTICGLWYGIFSVWPPPSNSDHQDEITYMFRGCQEKTSIPHPNDADIFFFNNSGKQ